MENERIILGIDPGSTIMGYGVVKQSAKNIEILDLGVLNMTKVADGFEKLKMIFHKTEELIRIHHPQVLSIESQFFGKNVQSMLKLGRAQGVAVAAALSLDLAVFEYAPRKIKMSITGSGTASKEQIAKALQQMLKIEVLPEKLDATDGLAAAICHCYQRQPVVEGKTYNSWKSFASNNPGRVR